eukprot:c22642_g2_i1 orf=850-1269(-)
MIGSSLLLRCHMLGRQIQPSTCLGSGLPVAVVCTIVPPCLLGPILNICWEHHTPRQNITLNQSTTNNLSLHNCLKLAVEIRKSTTHRKSEAMPSSHASGCIARPISNQTALVDTPCIPLNFSFSESMQHAWTANIIGSL